MEVEIDTATRPAADPRRIQRWIVIYLAILVGEESDTIDVDAPFSRFDLNSVDAVEMAAEFEKAFGCEIEPEFFLIDTPSVSEMVPRLVAAVEAATAKAQAEKG